MSRRSPPPANPFSQNQSANEARMVYDVNKGKPMETIEFHAVVDQDQIIRPPNGVLLPRGEVEVTVRSRQPEPAPSSDSFAATRAWLLALSADAEHAAPELPKDMAEHHDHYAHGKPRP